MSPALLAPCMGGWPPKPLPAKGDFTPKSPSLEKGIVPPNQAPSWKPHTLPRLSSGSPPLPVHSHTGKKKTQPQAFGGLRHRQALKSCSKMIIHKNLLVFMCSLIALQGGVKHSPRAGQLTGGNATPRLCLGQVYTCARQNRVYLLL